MFLRLCSFPCTQGPSSGGLLERTEGPIESQETESIILCH